jgi:hypothetical protein
MSETALRSYIKNLVDGATGTGVVHDYERWASQWSDLMTLYKVDGKLNGWYVTRRRASAEWDAMPTTRRRHIFEICGIYSLDDSAASEKTFHGIIENIFAAVKFDYNLGGNCLVAGPLQVEEVDVRMFGSVLCHYCLLTLPAEERELDT